MQQHLLLTVNFNPLVVTRLLPMHERTPTSQSHAARHVIDDSTSDTTTRTPHNHLVHVSKSNAIKVVLFCDV